MIIQVQLSSKIWHKQLLFICFPPNVVLSGGAQYYIMTEGVFLLSLFKIENGGVVLKNKACLKVLAVFRDEVAHCGGCALAEQTAHL